MKISKTVVRTTDVLTHESLDLRQIPAPETLKEHSYCTLKGRLELSKDYKGILWAMSQTPGISRVEFNHADFSVSCSWCLTHDHLTTEESLEFTCEYIDTFISKLKMVIANKVTEFKDMGIEPHIFIQSLKPIDEYDGERNGPWSE